MSGMGINLENGDQMEAVLSERSTSEINISYSDERGVEHIIVATGVTEGGRTKYVIENLEGSTTALGVIIDAAIQGDAYIEIRNFVIPNTGKAIRLQIGSKDLSNRDLRIFYNDREVFLPAAIWEEEIRYTINNRKEYLDEELENILYIMGYVGAHSFVLDGVEIELRLNNNGNIVSIVNREYRDVESLKAGMDLLAIRNVNLSFQVHIPAIFPTMVKLAITKRVDSESVWIIDVENQREQALMLQRQMVDGVKQYSIDGGLQSRNQQIISPTRMGNIIRLAHHMGIEEITFKGFQNREAGVNAAGQQMAVVTLPIRHMREIIKGLPLDTSLKSLRIEGSQLLPEDLLDFAKILEDNSSVIKYMTFDRNAVKINSMECRALFDVIGRNNEIEGLSLVENDNKFINGRVLWLLSILEQKTTLKSVGISGNCQPIIDETLDRLITVISKNPIEKLRMHNIALNSAQLEKLINAINVKPTLTNLSLCHVANGIEEQETMFRKLGDNRNIKTLSCRNYVQENDSSRYDAMLVAFFNQNRGLRSIDISGMTYAKVRPMNSDVRAALKRSLNADEIADCGDIVKENAEKRRKFVDNVKNRFDKGFSLDDLFTSIDGKRKLLEDGWLTLTDKRLILEKQNEAFTNLFVTLGVVKNGISPAEIQEETRIPTLPPTVINRMAQYVTNLFVTLGVVKENVGPAEPQSKTHISALPPTVIHLIAQYVFTEFGGRMLPSSQGRAR